MTTLSLQPDRQEELNFGDLLGDDENNYTADEPFRSADFHERQQENLQIMAAHVCCTTTSELSAAEALAIERFLTEGTNVLVEDNSLAMYEKMKSDPMMQQITDPILRAKIIALITGPDLIETLFHEERAVLAVPDFYEVLFLEDKGELARTILERIDAESKKDSGTPGLLPAHITRSVESSTRMVLANESEETILTTEDSETAAIVEQTNQLPSAPLPIILTIINKDGHTMTTVEGQLRAIEEKLVNDILRAMKEKMTSLELKLEKDKEDPLTRRIKKYEVLRWQYQLFRKCFNDIPEDLRIVILAAYIAEDPDVDYRDAATSVDTEHVKLTAVSAELERAEKVSKRIIIPLKDMSKYLYGASFEGVLKTYPYVQDNPVFFADLLMGLIIVGKGKTIEQYVDTQKKEKVIKNQDLTVEDYLIQKFKAIQRENGPSYADLIQVASNFRKLQSMDARARLRFLIEMGLDYYYDLYTGYFRAHSASLSLRPTVQSS